MAANALKIRKLSLGKSLIVFSLRGAHLNARLDPIALYGGTGSFAIDVDDSGALPGFHSVLELRSVALREFFDATLGVKQIEGAGSMKLDVRASGTDMTR
ncbi:MAG: hypothetical protein WDM89_08225 [Rhizomicrobium sp.]